MKDFLLNKYIEETESLLTVIKNQNLNYSEYYHRLIDVGDIIRLETAIKKVSERLKQIKHEKLHF